MYVNFLKSQDVPKRYVDEPWLICTSETRFITEEENIAVSVFVEPILQSSFGRSETPPSVYFREFGNKLFRSSDFFIFEQQSSVFPRHDLHFSSLLRISESFFNGLLFGVCLAFSSLEFSLKVAEAVILSG